MASPNVADFLVQRLADWGVRRIYGYAGDGINTILGALNRAGNRPEFIQPAHEELAALMACAHAKYTGEIGVCLATSGPGAIHLLNGLYDASLDHQPVLAMVGQQDRTAIGGRYQQEIDLVSLFKDVAKAYVQMASSAAQMRHLLDRAIRVALAERTVTCLIVPHDLQKEPAVEEPPHEHGAVHSGVGYAAPRILPAEAELRRAAEVLNAGEKVAMLVGAGALQATDEVIAVAERLAAGVAKALLGKAAVPDDLPFVTGSAGWLGTSASNAMLQQCDTLLLVGTGFPYSEFLPPEGTVRAVQIDIDGGMLSLRYPVEVGLVGDSAETLHALLPLLNSRMSRSAEGRQREAAPVSASGVDLPRNGSEDGERGSEGASGSGAWRRWIEDQVTDWWRSAEARAMHPADPLNPQRVFWELSPRLPDDCILAGDSGSSTVWYARHLKIRRGMKASLSGTLATMGSAVPYALAAKFAYPERLVVAIVGDGAMQMNGINGLLTVARFYSRWRDPRLIILVLNNRDLNYVTWEQRVMEGEARFSPSQDVPDFPYARYAEMLGLKGIRVDSPDGVAAAWDEALAADRPVVFEAVVDPNVPTVPPQLKPEQEQKLRQALQGDPQATAVLRQAALEGALTEGG